MRQLATRCLDYTIGVTNSVTIKVRIQDPFGLHCQGLTPPPGETHRVHAALGRQPDLGARADHTAGNVAV